MNIFGIQIERITKIQSPILHRDSVFLIICLMQCLWIYSIIIPQFTEKYFSNFSNLQRNIMSTERLFILDAVLRRSARLSKAFSMARPTRLKNAFIRRSEPCYIEKSGTPQHNTVSKIGLIRVNFKCNNYSMSLLITSRKNNIRSIH